PLKNAGRLRVSGVGPVYLAGRRTARLRELLQALADAETDSLPGLDLDRLTGVRVAPDARLADLDLERAEARDRHRSFLAQPLADAVEHGVEEVSRGQLRGVQLVGDLGDEIALVHGGWREVPM